MILDNHNVPEIIVDRENSRNNNSPIDINNSSEDCSGDRKNFVMREVVKINSLQGSPVHNIRRAERDDVCQSPRRIPLTTNNNGSPRLTNRVANIYNKQAVYRQENLDESLQNCAVRQAAGYHGSPKRAVLTERNHHENLLVDVSELEKSPKRSSDDRSPILTAGYHNPYITNDKKKSPTMNFFNEIIFNYDSPKHKISTENDYLLTESISSVLSDSSEGQRKSKIPTKIPSRKTGGGLKVKNMNDSVTSNSSERSLFSPKMKRFSDYIDSNLSNSTTQSNPQNEMDSHPAKNNCNQDVLLGSATTDNSVDNRRTSIGSDVWNSKGECDGTDNSWGSNSLAMSVDDKNSLKKSTNDSMRTRTFSLGSMPHSAIKDAANTGSSLSGIVNVSDTDSGLSESVTSKMLIIKCKDGNYLTRVFTNNQGVQGVKIVGRVGRVGSNHHCFSPIRSPSSRGGGSVSGGMSAAHSPLHLPHGKVTMSCDSSNCSQSGLTEEEFDHGTADYQWLLDYEYRESYTKDSLGTMPGGREGSVRVSVLDTNPDSNIQDISYETLSRNLDANLAEIDMDDFRSDDIHQLLSMQSVCGQCQMEESGSNPQSTEHTPVKTRRQCRNKSGECSGEYELEEEEYSGVSGELSLYQSGPLFSPLKEPPPIGNTTFSVDSLDCESFHDDLILTCKANKDNYTIAFEGSFIQYSEDSDYHDAGETDSTTSGSWVTDGVETRPSGHTMTHSDQPYTTWSRVSKKSGPHHADPRTQTDVTSSPVRVKHHHHHHHHHQHTPTRTQHQKHLSVNSAEDEHNKCNSMPNLMRRSLMRQSLDTTGNCVKVFDLQNSLRCSHSARQSDVNNSFSLVRLFMKQKSLSKEAFSLTSSCASRSQEAACCSSSENQSAVDSSDWPMNSQSDDMEGSASPIPPHSHLINNQNLYEHKNRRKSGGDTKNMNKAEYTSETNYSATLEHDTGMINNNNTLNQLLDQQSDNFTGCDNVTCAFEENVKETSQCSKAPVTSPIREEPEGMDISFDSRCEHKVINDQSETETKSNNSSVSSIETNKAMHRVPTSPARSVTSNRNVKHIDDKIRSKSPGTPTKTIRKQTPQRHRQDSGNASGLPKAPSDRVRKTEGLTPAGQRPRPKPRILKHMTDQCLQTSNLKVSATMNTSALMERKDVYVYYPNYALPDLSFLKDKKYNVDARIFLVPQHYNKNPDLRKIREVRTKRPFSCNDMEKLRKRGLNHVKDWDSLNVLLPKELKEMLSDHTDCMETIKPSFCASPRPAQRPVSCVDFGSNRDEMTSANSSLNSTQPSSGYRGSSTLLNDSEDQDAAQGDNPPPLPKRSVSLPYEEEETEKDGESPPPRPPLPRGILRKTTSLKEEAKAKKRGGKVASKDEGNKRRSLQEPIKEHEAVSGDAAVEHMGCSCLNAATCTGFCAKGLTMKNLMRVSELPNISTHEEFTDKDLADLRSKVSNFLVGNSFGDGVCDLCPKKSVTFVEKNCSHLARKSSNKSEADSESMTRSDERPVVYDAADKKTLVLSVRSAVEKLVSTFSHSNKNKDNSTPSSAKVSQITLDKLCPAIYALLSDGLQPSLHSLFGKITNSVWRVVEATSQMGPSTKALNDLVMTLNSEETLSEGPMKFNAFIFGLINIRSLDSWLSYLRTRESVMQKHYHPEAFLYLANTATRTLYDDLLAALRPLALMPLHLDLLYEYKTLHASLLKMEERLRTSCSSVQSPGEKSTSVLLDHLLVAKETKEFKNTAAAQQDKVKALMKVLTSPDENSLLQAVASSVIKERSKSPRPRSCYENEEGGEELHPSLKKRWSNVQFGSKLITAIDKLMLEEGACGSSEDYTDSLDNPKRGNKHSDGSFEDTDLRVSEMSNREEDISERSATYKDTENEKEFRFCPTSLAYKTNSENEGGKFRRLQMKWEKMADNKPEEIDEDSTLQAANNTPLVSPHSRDKLVSPSSGTRSKIPRPVSITSPQRPFKAFEPAKEKTSPVIKPPLYTRALKDLPKPAPRRSLKDKEDTSRAVPLKARRAYPTCGNVMATGTRASSMPGRSESSDRSAATPSGRYDNKRLSKGPVPRSASHGRRLVPGNVARYVQTLHHRLATDNGHLSFNRGDVLTVVVEVDERYLLCCLHDRKGLVPRASVIVANAVQ